MPISKEDIRTRLRVVSKWIETEADNLVATVPTPTNIFTVPAGSPAIPERQMRYIVSIMFPGDLAQTQRIEIFKLLEAGTYETKWCPIPVAAADFRQIPEGSYSIEDPILTLSGGENLAASTDVVGSSLNLTVVFWDADI